MKRSALTAVDSLREIKRRQREQRQRELERLEAQLKAQKEQAKQKIKQQQQEKNASTTKPPRPSVLPSALSYPSSPLGSFQRKSTTKQNLKAPPTSVETKPQQHLGGASPASSISFSQNSPLSSTVARLSTANNSSNKNGSATIPLTAWERRRQRRREQHLYSSSDDSSSDDHQLRQRRRRVKNKSGDSRRKSVTRETFKCQEDSSSSSSVDKKSRKQPTANNGGQPKQPTASSSDEETLFQLNSRSHLRGVLKTSNSIKRKSRSDLRDNSSSSSSSSDSDAIPLKIHKHKTRQDFSSQESCGETPIKGKPVAHNPLARAKLMNSPLENQIHNLETTSKRRRRRRDDSSSSSASSRSRNRSHRASQDQVSESGLPAQSQNVTESPKSSHGGSVARNPLALSRANRPDTIHHSSPAVASARSLDALWSDSSDEPNDETLERVQKRKKAVKTKTSSPSRGGRPTVKKVSLCKDMEWDDDNDEDALKPEFPEPLFGPWPLEPLLLQIPEVEEDELKKKGESLLKHLSPIRTRCLEKPFQVPPAVSRYLGKYQQEGVLFMFRTIFLNGGGILGDGMLSLCSMRSRFPLLD